MIQTVADLMTPNPFSVSINSTLHDAHNLMKEKNVRHIPVINDDGVFVGMLTQKIMIAKVMGIVSTFGPNALERKEKKTNVADIMVSDFASVTPEQPLYDVVKFFVNTRHGCIPVINDQRQLIGILTSSDFVNLAAALLS